MVRVPPEVHAFAAESGVAPYLPAVLELTPRVFPTARRFTVLVEDDPEIANDRHIALEVEPPTTSVPELFAGRQQWVTEIFRHCPSTHAWVFRLGMA